MSLRHTEQPLQGSRPRYVLREERELHRTPGRTRPATFHHNLTRGGKDQLVGRSFFFF